MFISWEHVKEMSENNISFGAHTCSHIIVTKVPLAKAEEEIVRSRKIIQDKIGKEVKVFSYPNGMEEDYNQEIIKILQRNKFSYATLAMDGINRLGEIIENPYTLRRVGMRSYDNLDYFKLQLSGALVSFRRIRNALWGESPS
jgi:peptidoglycan/xylan/chitin deacetylase (PgdA/CDA1 family)